MLRTLHAWAARGRRSALLQSIEQLEERMSCAMESLNTPAQSEASYTSSS